MGFLFKTRPKPVEVVYKILESFSNEDLRVLNSCETYKLEGALLEEFQKQPLEFKFRRFKKAVPIIKNFLDDLNANVEAPLSEKALAFGCKYIKGALFYEI